MKPEVHYAVSLIDDVWRVSLEGRTFGPYSNLDAAMAAASAAAHKAEIQGYQAFVAVTAPDPDAGNGEQNAA